MSTACDLGTTSCGIGHKYLLISHMKIHMCTGLVNVMYTNHTWQRGNYFQVICSLNLLWYVHLIDNLFLRSVTDREEVPYINYSYLMVLFACLMVLFALLKAMRVNPLGSYRAVKEGLFSRRRWNMKLILWMPHLWFKIWTEFNNTFHQTPRVFTDW